MTSKDDLSIIVEQAKNYPEVLKEISSWSKTFQFDVSDEPPYYVSIEKGAVSLEDGKSESAAATISASGAILSDMFAGNLNPVQAFMSGQLRVSGDIFSAQKLTSVINKARK